VKIRGYRIELGEIEAVLGNHPLVREVAVVVRERNSEARITACIVPQTNAPTLLMMKQYCAERLARYMIVDDLLLLEQLPRTGTGKVDRITLSTQGYRKNGAF
jgi:acyl-coenzyme A synthetase/AMP-(fatty) acid ligase